MVEQLSLAIGYDVGSFYNGFYGFMRNDYPNLVEFYSGRDKNPNVSSFSRLKHLLNEAGKISELIHQKRDGLNEFEFWEILDEVEDMTSRLTTADRLWKWMRSSVVNSLFSADPKISVVTTQNQSLEELAQGLGIDEWDDRWMELAIKNNIKEEDYTNDGGLFMNVSFEGGKTAIINDVIDAMIGERVYGKDLYKVITFEDDDLKALPPVETIYQCIEILINLTRGDFPNDPDFGIRKVVGENIKSIAFPTLFRQMQQTLGSDDIIRSVALKEIKKEEDIIYMVVAITIKYGGEIVKKIEV